MIYSFRHGKTYCPYNFNCSANNSCFNSSAVHETYQIQAIVDIALIIFCFYGRTQIIQLFEYLYGTPSFTWQMIDEWIGVLISFFIIVGVVLIREIFYSLKRAEIDRLKIERRVINAIINTEENEKEKICKGSA